MLYYFIEYFVMLKKNKVVNGFKFSFKEDNYSSQSTPKFTSIQLCASSLDPVRQQIQYKKQSLLPRGVDKKIKSKPKPQSSAKIKKINTFTQNSRNLYFNQQVNKSAKSLKDIQTQKLIHSFRKQYKTGRNTEAKKVAVMNKGKIQYKQKQQHKYQFFQTSIPFQQQKKTTTKSNRRTFKKQDKQQILLEDQSLERTKKNKTRQLSLNVKKQYLLSDLVEKTQSPKSPKSMFSQRNSHKEIKYISTNYFTNKKEAQILDTGVFPQTDKSRRLLTEVGERDKMSTFFKRHDTKKSIVAKNLFKSQKSNLNVRLNNMGSGISRLNIFIQ